MNTISRTSTFATLTFAAVAAVAAMLLVVSADAGARERHTSVAGANGKTATRDVDRSNGDVQSTTTGANGKTSARSVDRSASGTVATVTGPNGKTAARQTTVQK